MISISYLTGQSFTFRVLLTLNIFYAIVAKIIFVLFSFDLQAARPCNFDFNIWSIIRRKAPSFNTCYRAITSGSTRYLNKKIQKAKSILKIFKYFTFLTSSLFNAEYTVEDMIRKKCIFFPFNFVNFIDKIDLVSHNYF